MAQVIWVDLLTEEEFTAGFGSHTPMFTGQTKCVRYYMNFQLALGLLKEVLAEVWRAYASPYQLTTSLVLKCVCVPWLFITTLCHVLAIVGCRPSCDGHSSLLHSQRPGCLMPSQRTMQPALCLRS